MIKHAVLIRFKAEIDRQQREALYAALASLQFEMAGWLGFMAGDNVTPEVGMDKGFNGGFVIDFMDAAARDAYLVHPRHQALGAQLVAAAQAGRDGILVFDWEL